MRRGTGVTSTHLLFKCRGSCWKSHIQMWPELCICMHSTLETVGMLFSEDMYFSDSCIATICWSGSSWQVISWISHSEWQLACQRVFSQWVCSVISDKLHERLQATLGSPGCTFVIHGSLNSSDIPGSNLCDPMRTCEVSFKITDSLCPIAMLFPDATGIISITHNVIHTS